MYVLKSVGLASGIRFQVSRFQVSRFQVSKNKIFSLGVHSICRGTREEEFWGNKTKNGKDVCYGTNQCCTLVMQRATGSSLWWVALPKPLLCAGGANEIRTGGAYFLCGQKGEQGLAPL